MQAIRDMMVFLSAVLLAHPLTVSTALHMGYLIGVGQVSLHRLANALVKGLCRLPAQFLFQLSCIDRITAVMARAVSHIRDLGALACAIGLEAQLVQPLTEHYSDAMSLRIQMFR
jgi:hypothetical protein